MLHIETCEIYLERYPEKPLMLIYVFLMLKVYEPRIQLSN